MDVASFFARSRLASKTVLRVVLEANRIRIWFRISKGISFIIAMKEP